MESEKTIQDTPHNAGAEDQGKLPPLKPEDSSDFKSPLPAEGISPALKRTVIGFTVFTLLAFGLFGAMFVKSMLKNKSGTGSKHSHFLTVAAKLEAAGLKEQAIRQYETYLSKDDIDSHSRAETARKTGELYITLNNCREGLVWFYHAETAWPEAPWVAELNQSIDACLGKIQNPPR